jgi:hypothetical protein
VGPKGKGISVEEMALDVGQATLAATNLLTWRLLNWSLQRGKRKGEGVKRLAKAFVRMAWVPVLHLCMDKPF